MERPALIREERPAAPSAVLSRGGANGEGGQPKLPGPAPAPRCCPSALVLPTLCNPEKPGALAQGDSQLQALHQLVEDGSVRAVLHAGPAVYKLFGKSVSECEMTHLAR